MNFRPLRPDDIEAVLQVRVAMEVADDLPLRTPLDELTEELTEEGMSWDTDTIGVFDGQRCVAYAWVQPPGAPLAVGQWANVHVVVHPDHTGKGLGRALLELVESRGRDQLATAVERSGNQSLVAYLDSRQERAARMAAAAGYAIERYYDEMAVRLATRPTVPVPEVTVIGWDRSHDESARGIKNDAFADHWASVPTSPQQWQRQIESDRFRADLSMLAFDGEELIGFLVTHVYPEDWPVTGRDEARISLIGVPRHHRGRGIATAMIDRVLKAAHGDGLTHVALGVDTENPTGARGLYANLGFEPTSQLHRWAKAVAP